MKTIIEIYNANYGKIVLCFWLIGLVSIPFIHSIQTNLSTSKIIILLITLTFAMLFLIKNSDYFLHNKNSKQHNYSKIVLFLIVSILFTFSNMKLINAIPLVNSDTIVGGQIADKNMNFFGLYNTLEIIVGDKEKIAVNVSRDIFYQYRSGDYYSFKAKKGLLGDIYNWNL